MAECRALVALTGATGFVGRALLADLRAQGFAVRALLRRPVPNMPDTDSVVIGDLARPINLSQAFEGVDLVVHSAGLTPQMTGQPGDDFRAINTEGTLRLAKAAARNRVQRFIFLSSVRAQSGPVAAQVLTEDMPPRPTCAYGQSKLDAERGLAEVGMEWAALRSVLVYGAGHTGNLARLMRLARTPLPLPLPVPSGRRSLLAVENLCAAVTALCRCDAPIAGPYLVADDDAPLSVTEVVGEIRRGARRPSLTVPVPAAAMRTVAGRIGQREAIDRLAGDLVVATDRLKALGWQPRITTREGLQRLGAAG